MRWVVGLVASLGAVGILVVVGTSTNRGQAHHGWSTQHLAGNTQLKGEVPLPVSTGVAAYVRPHPSKAVIKLSFGLPLRDRAALDQLIAQQAKTHTHLSRDELYARFSPPSGQIDALRSWLETNGFNVTHLGRDRLALTASATTATVQKALHVKINDYIRPAFQFHAVKVKPFVFYSNTADPTLPASLGIQSISGLSDVDRFFTQAQLDCGDDDAVISPLCIDVRSGGYFPSDLRGMYDIAGHGIDATGQTIGFTLWTAAERQPAMTTFATNTGDTPITIDPNCVATGNSPTVPSSCTTQTVAADHLLFILENGNLDNNFGSNVETALDIEAAHGVATHAGMKYYASDCANVTPPGSGLTNAGCNGSDVGLEEAIEDAANDPTLHSVSNSWAFGGEAEWGAVDPFLVAAENSLTIAAAAGTTFYFSTGDSGTYLSGYPSDSPHVVGVGGTSMYSTTTNGQLSTSTTWSGGGSWCSNVIARPAWQTGAGVTANAPCPGRVIPDISAVADPATGVRFTSTTNVSGGTQSGQVGGTSLAAPVMNGLQAVTQNFVAAQTYPGGTAPSLGFVAPVLYQLGNSANYASYYNDIECGNTANPTSGPDGDAAGKGWDAATGWGEPDWFNFATGYAITLGATNLSVPPSLSRHLAWSCAKTPSNSTERSISFPTALTGYAVGNASGATPWYGKFLTAGSWGAVNTFFKSTDGGESWFPSNSDMFSITCTSSSTCAEVGAGGRERMTTDGGSTWSDVATAPGNNKPLTQLACPSSSICYAVGDRGNAMKSIDGGLTWSWQNTTDGNPLYGLSCPSTTVCYATDIYAHVIKTSDGGATWTWQQTPITTPGLAVPGSGGPNPFAGLMAISCSDANTCVASGLYVVASGQTIPSIDPPIVTTTDGGTTWIRRTSNAGAAAVATTTLSAAAAAGSTNIKVASVSNFTVGQPIVVDSGGANPETVTVTNVGTAGAAGTGISFTPALAFAHASGATITVTFAPNYLHGISCLPGTRTCTAVGRGGAIVTTTNLTSWTKVTSNVNTMLNSVTCLSTTFCMASGQNGTVDIFNGTTWTPRQGLTSSFLAGITCVDTTTCYTTGKQGVTLATTDGGSTWTQQTGGGTAQQMSSVSCPTVSACFAVGNAGTVIVTANGGLTWQQQLAATNSNLNGVSCASATTCVAVGGVIAGPTTASAAAAAGATNIKVASVTGFLTGQGITIDVGASAENVTITAVGTAGATGTGITFTPALASAHAAGATVVAGPATVRYTTDGLTWNTGTSTGTNALSGVVCSSSSTCVAVGAAGTVLTTANGGSTWAPATSGTNLSLSAVACAGGACYATGQATAGQAVMLKSLDGGSTWSSQASNSNGQALGGIACVDSSNCFADGTLGTVVATTDGGATWTPRGNPLGGPTTALNATTIVLFGAACTSGRCVIGTGVQGDIMATPLLTVTVHSTSVYGSSSLGLSGLTPADPAITYSLAGEAANVTGSLTCTTTATVVSHPGSYPITACNGLADSGGFSIVYDYANSSHVVTKFPQTITFDPLADKTYGDPNFDVSAFAPGGPVSFTASGECTVSNSTVHITGGGSCSITASQPGTSDALPAADVTQSFAIQKAEQSISFGTLSDGTFGDADFNIDATATSGLTVALHAAGPCTLSSAVSPANVHIGGAGSCSITASQAGNDNYRPAPDEVRSFSISKSPQHITFNALGDKTYGDSDFGVSATASSGLAVSFGATGNCNVSGGTVHITGAGPCSITASQGGDGNYDPAPDVTQSFAIAKADQTITFDQPADHTFGDADFGVTPSASSHLAVSLALAPGGACTLSGTTIHIVTAGSCSLTATQAGDSNYNPAPDVPRTFAVRKADQTITFAAIPDKTWGDADFSIAPTAGSRLDVTVASTGECHLVGFLVHITAAGSCSITASQAGNGNYNAAPDVKQSFAIRKTDQTITFPTLADQTYGDPDVHVDAAASSRLDVALSVSGPCTLSVGTAPALAHIVGAGTCSITASQAGDSNFNPAANVTRTFVVRKANQTITFAAIPNHLFGDVDFTLGATASSGLPVSYAAGGPCAVSGATVHITALGSCTITASQGGNANYNAAPNVSRSFMIVNSTSGEVNGDDVKPTNGGNASFHIEVMREGLKGNLSYEGPELKTKPSTKKVHIEAKRFTAFSVAADGQSATFAGVDKEGHTFLVYVEDHGKKKPSTDVFRLWIDGVLQTAADGRLAQGKIEINSRPNGGSSGGDGRGSSDRGD